MREREEEKCMLKNYYNFYFCRGSFYAIAIIVATLCYNTCYPKIEREREKERERIKATTTITEMKLVNY